MQTFQYCKCTQKEAHTGTKIMCVLENQGFLQTHMHKVHACCYRCTSVALFPQMERAKDVKHEPVYTQIQTRTRSAVPLPKWLSYCDGQQATTHWEMRNQCCYTIHAIHHQQGGHNKMTVDLGQTCQKSEDEVSQTGDTSANNTELIMQYWLQIQQCCNRVSCKFSWIESVHAWLTMSSLCNTTGRGYMLTSSHQRMQDDGAETSALKSSGWTGSASVRTNGMWSFWNSDGPVGRAPPGGHYVIVSAKASAQFQYLTVEKSSYSPEASVFYNISARVKGAAQLSMVCLDVCNRQNH